MRKALAIDLDGTLLDTNTFRDYLSYCGQAATHSFRIDIAFKILWWVSLRKLRLISHSRMKQILLSSTTTFFHQKGLLDNFVEQELLHVNHKAQQLMEPYRNRGYLLILVTAAPDLYAHPIAENLHIDLCCATPLPSEVVIGKWKENVGEEKVNALKRLLKVHGAELEVVITDHEDDLPLIRYNKEGRNCLVNPAETTLKVLAKEENLNWEKV